MCKTLPCTHARSGARNLAPTYPRMGAENPLSGTILHSPSQVTLKVAAIANQRPHLKSRIGLEWKSGTQAYRLWGMGLSTWKHLLYVKARGPDINQASDIHKAKRWLSNPGGSNRWLTERNSSAWSPFFEGNAACPSVVLNSKTTVN